MGWAVEPSASTFRSCRARAVCLPSRDLAVAVARRSNNCETFSRTFAVKGSVDLKANSSAVGIVIACGPYPVLGTVTMEKAEPVEATPCLGEGMHCAHVDEPTSSCESRVIEGDAVGRMAAAASGCPAPSIVRSFPPGSPPHSRRSRCCVSRGMRGTCCRGSRDGKRTLSRAQSRAATASASRATGAGSGT